MTPNAVSRDDGGRERACPECEDSMACDDAGYVYVWTCNNDDCGNADGYWDIYDWYVFGRVKEAQRKVGLDAARRLATEFDDGALTDVPDHPFPIDLDQHSALTVTRSRCKCCDSVTWQLLDFDAFGDTEDARGCNDCGQIYRA